MKDTLKSGKNVLNTSSILPTNIDRFSSDCNYQKFLVITSGRSGSNLLLGALNSHSQAIIYGEIFQEIDRVDWGFPKKNEVSKDKDLVSFRNQNPEQFLETMIFKKYPDSILGVGFKILYSQARQNSQKIIWRFLQERKDIKIIHLTRNNLLKSLLSLEKAIINDNWIVFKQENEQKIQDLTIPLNYQKCLDYFTSMQKIISVHNLLFKNHDKLNVVYENLSTNFTDEIKRIQNFIGLDYENLVPATLQQSSLRLSESIANYDELKQQFKNTKWEKFFED